MAPPPADRTPPFDLSLQNVLLALGTALVAVAALVFAAVNWNRMDASLQGAFLVALTAVAAGLTASAARRSMPATAEALGVVTLLLGLADARAVQVGLLPGADPAAYWAIALGVAALGGWALGTITGVRSPRIVAAGLAQLPVPVAAIGSALSPTVVESVLLGQVAAVTVLVRSTPRALRPARVVAALGALATGGVVTTVALATSVLESGRDRLGPAAVVALAASVAGVAAWAVRDRDGERELATGVAALLGFFAVLVVADVQLSGPFVAPAVAAVGAVLLGIGVRIDRRWGAVPAGVAGVVVSIGSLPALSAVTGAVAGALQVAGRPWSTGAGVRASALVREVQPVLASGALALHLLVLGAVVLALAPLLGRRWTGVAVIGVATAALVAAPLLLPLSAGGASIVALLGAAAAVALAVLRSSHRPALLAASGTAAVLAAVGALWAMAAPATSLLGAAAVSGLAFLLVDLGRRTDEADLALPATVVSVLAGSVAIGVTASMAGLDGPSAAVAGSVGALALGVVGAQVLDPTGRRRDLDGQVSIAVEVVAALVHGWALVLVAGQLDARAASVVLAAGTVAAGLHATRPGRRGLALVAAIEALALTWLQVGLAGITAVEAYTLPLAVVLAGSGWWAGRQARATGDRLPSWATAGPALVVAFVPTVVAGLTDPGLVRPLGGLVAGAALLVAGTLTRRRAGVDVGVAVVVVLGLRQLAPVVGHLPNWATLGATGLVLLAVGATFEQRKRDLHEVRDRYAALR